MIGGRGKFDSLEQAFRAHFKAGEHGECWLWLGHINHAGYGQLQFRGRRYMANRLALEFSTGIDLGALCACHRCDNPGCVNPSHLFAGSHGDNARDRAIKKRGFRQEATACVRGHPFSPENTYSRPNGARQCRACNRASAEAYYYRKTRRAA